MDPETFDVTIRVIQLVLASASCIINGIAALKGAAYRKTVHFIIALLSALYAAGFAYVLIGGDYEQFSSFFRGVNIVTWSVVWILPAVLHIMGWKKVKQAVEETFTQAVDEAVKQAARGDEVDK
jgi:predicted naringenin-chalcone synthase